MPRSDRSPTIGVGANVGAGSITANYDGVHKHRTVIGSHVRTGSHGVFVAPVTIGDGAYTGAGTVVRKDVPAGSLAINVAPQRNIEGWVEQHRPGTAAADAATAARQAEATEVD
jgi:bifunctional UDP-N-acetylglucosamine pyrophosphorylase/glucosamine-1-phosphate N-acetyltransferase